MSEEERVYKEIENNNGVGKVGEEYSRVKSALDTAADKRRKEIREKSKCKAKKEKSLATKSLLGRKNISIG